MDIITYSFVSAISRFADANVLSINLCGFHHASMWLDFWRRRIKLFVGETWKVVADESRRLSVRKWEDRGYLIVG